MIVVPDAFAAATIERDGEDGRVWIETLPDVVDELCARWELRIEGDVMHGYLAIVVPVTRDGEELALKVGWIYEDTEHEALALKTWAGDGAVSIIDHDAEHGAMLLERLDPSVSLETVPLSEAVPTAARLLRRLTVPCPDGPPSIAAKAQRWLDQLRRQWATVDNDVPRRALDAALEACAMLGTGCGDQLVNDDLHYGNVLRGSREPWLVIDPKPLRGDPEFSVAPLVWRRLEARRNAMVERIDEIVDVAELDADLAWGWTLQRTVVDALWSASMGFWDGHARSATIATWLAS